MQDIVNQLLAYFKGCWNKRWQGMFVAWLGCLVGWTVVYYLPNQYQSKAEIYIDTQSLLKPLLEGLAVQTNVKQEISLMVKTLLTRPNVEKIIRLSDLDLSVTNENEFDKLVKDLQKDIKFKKTSRTKVNLYSLSYKNKAPDVTQKVLQSVITVFVENSIGRNKEDTNSARIFIDKQIIGYEKRLADSENRLKLSKQKNMGVLPSSAGDFYARMEQTKLDLQKVKLELKETEREKSAIDKELNDFIASIKKSVTNDKSMQQTAYDSRIETLSAELDALLLNYTDNHPDVKSVERVLKKLKAKRRKELASKRKFSSSVSGILESNLIYQELTIKLGTLNSKIAGYQVRLVEYQERYNDLMSRVDHIPEVEAQLSALNRDYDITKKKYEELLVRREAASLSENINKTSDGVQFNVVDPPRVGKKPVGPNRILLSTIVLLLSIGAGAGFSLMLSQIKSVFNSARELEQMIALPIWGTVTAASSPGQRRRRIFLIMTYLSLLFILLLVYAGLVAWYIDDFWLKINALLKL